MTDYLTMAEVLAIHEDQIERYGGSQGIRDKGNKPTAFAAMYTFLAINGVRLTADPEDTYAFVANLHESCQFSFDNLVPWLRSHATLR